jgi:hypothetical protein
LVLGSPNFSAEDTTLSGARAGIRLRFERDEPLQLSGFLVSLQAVDEIDFDLRVAKTGGG